MEMILSEDLEQTIYLKMTKIDHWVIKTIIFVQSLRVPKNQWLMAFSLPWLILVELEFRSNESESFLQARFRDETCKLQKLQNWRHNSILLNANFIYHVLGLSFLEIMIIYTCPTRWPRKNIFTLQDVNPHFNANF